MDIFTKALPVTVEQWVAALSTLVLAIAGLLRKRQQPPSDNGMGR